MQNAGSKTTGSSAKLPHANDKLISHKNATYTLERILGEGGYGTVFQCSTDDNRKYALKVEMLEKTALKVELYVLSAVAAKKCKHFCEVIDWGERQNEYFFVVMTLLNMDLARLRCLQMGTKFSLSCALRVAMQTLNALEELHSCRFVSRDVKPSNFAPGVVENRRLIFMFDFGLARKYMDRSHKVYPARPSVGFRGTIRYGAMAAHLKQDLGRKADLESWFYMVVEFTKGSLPWRRITDKPRVLLAKIDARTKDRNTLFANCPQCYDAILTAIDELSFEAEPPYRKIMDHLIQCCNENNVVMESRYDWEEQEPSSTTEHSSSKMASSEMKQEEDLKLNSAGSFAPDLAPIAGGAAANGAETPTSSPAPLAPVTSLPAAAAPPSSSSKPQQ